MSSKDRKNKIGTGDRSERIRTYNFPQGRVTDHRINLTLHKLEEFMQGEIFDPTFCHRKRFLTLVFEK